jgi:hypothetical protein
MDVCFKKTTVACKALKWMKVWRGRVSRKGKYVKFRKSAFKMVTWFWTFLRFLSQNWHFLPIMATIRRVSARRLTINNHFRIVFCILLLLKVFKLIVLLPNVSTLVLYSGGREFKSSNDQFFQSKNLVFQELVGTCEAS